MNKKRMVKTTNVTEPKFHFMLDGSIAACGEIIPLDDSRIWKDTREIDQNEQCPKCLAAIQVAATPKTVHA